MEFKEKIRLEALYASLSDEALEDMLVQPADSYQPGVYPLLQAEAGKRGLSLSKEAEAAVPAAGTGTPAHQPCFEEFMTVDNADDLAFMEGVFRCAQIPYVLEEASGQPGTLRVMVEQGWMEQANELFREEDNKKPQE